MIKLYAAFNRNRCQLETDDIFCHARLYKDLQELLTNQRLSSSNCHTAISKPLWMENIYKMNVDITVHEGPFKNIQFRVRIHLLGIVTNNPFHIVQHLDK